MINSQVLQYIKTESGKGTSREVITQNLVAGGNWTPEEIQAHFNAFDAGNFAHVPIKGVDNTALKSKNARSIILINLGLFVVYALLSFAVNPSILIIAGVHLGILLICTVVLAISSQVKKTPTNWQMYLLSAVLIGIAGFGTCFALAFSGSF